MVRFAVTPPPKKSPSAEPFAPQLALSRVHPCLVPLSRAPHGCAPQIEATRGWFELHSTRGLAGYGLARALRMLLDALTGLTALEGTKNASGAPFVHGELVPAMIRVDPTGVARLIALAPWHWSARGTLPAHERCGHLAPERLLGDVIDARADVFSAGVLLWEALAGGRLFERDSVDTIVMRLLGEKVTLPQLPPELSWAAPLKAVAMCALAVDPQLRFANCAELAEAIEDITGDRLATHADVAKFFASAKPNAHPSSIARPASAPTHNSSLSALIAPAAGAPVPEANETQQRAARVPASQITRRLWAAAGISCLVTALGVSAVAGYSSSLEPRHSAAPGAPMPGAPMSSAPPLASAPPTPPTPPTPPAASLPTIAALPAASAVEPSAAASPSKGPKPHKALKGGKSSNALAPKLAQPSKAAPTPDRAAVKYGI